MPSREEHCEHTFNRYGIRGEDIHAFLDEPSKLAGQKHRQFRHDIETVKLVGRVFEKKYGREMAENIALDHIMLDRQTETRVIPVVYEDKPMKFIGYCLAGIVLFTIISFILIVIYALFYPF